MFDTGIRPGEWAFVGAWTLALLAVLAAPYAHGYLVAPPGWRFAGFVGPFHNDYEGYLAWMRQAADGHLLFKDAFTTEPHGRIFFHPAFWLIGATARLAQVDPVVVWQAVQALSCVLLIVALYRFAAHFTDDVATRVTALVLTTTAAGWGWLTNPPETAPLRERATDLWMAEANAFNAMATSFFTLPLALAFMVLAFLHALRAVRSGATRDAVLAGLYALGLATTHQYDMVTLYGVLGTFTVLVARTAWRTVAIVIAISLPFCLYSVAVVRLDPVFAIHTSAPLPSPTVLAYGLGWGLPLVLALAALALPAVRRHGRDVEFLGVWLVVNLALLAVPIGFQRKLMWGVHVPMCLLGAMLVVRALRGLARGAAPVTARAIVAAGVLALTVTSAAGNVPLYRSFFERNAAQAVGDYLPPGYLELFAWLDGRCGAADAVLASLSVAPLIPGRTGCVVYAGHWAQTVDVATKAERIAALFGPPGSLAPAEVHRTLADGRVRWLVLDQADREILDIPPDQSAFPFTPFADEVLRNPLVTVWQVKAAP